MAAALSPDDDPALHAADTIAAGAGLVDPIMAGCWPMQAPTPCAVWPTSARPFDRDGEGALFPEPGGRHSRPRVARVGGDGAGRAIMLAVIAAVRADPNIEIIEGAEVRALLQDGRAGCAARWSSVTASCRRSSRPPP